MHVMYTSTRKRIYIAFTVEKNQTIVFRDISGSMSLVIDRSPDRTFFSPKKKSAIIVFRDILGFRCDSRSPDHSGCIYVARAIPKSMARRYINKSQKQVLYYEGHTRDVGMHANVFSESQQ